MWKFFRCAPERDHFEINGQGMAVLLDLNVLALDGSILLPGFQNRRPQSSVKPLPDHLEEVQRGAPRRRFQERAGMAAELQDFKFGIDDHAGRRVTREQKLVGLSL